MGGNGSEPLSPGAELSSLPPLLLPDAGSRPQAGQGAGGLASLWEAGEQEGASASVGSPLGRLPTAPPPTSPKRGWVGNPRRERWPPGGLTGPAGPPALLQPQQL